MLKEGTCCSLASSAGSSGGEAPHGVLVFDCALDADRVGELVDLGCEGLGAGEAEHVIDAVRLAPVHDLRPTIVPSPRMVMRVVGWPARSRSAMPSTKR